MNFSVSTATAPALQRYCRTLRTLGSSDWHRAIAEDITGARTFADLPATAQAYVRRLEELSGAPFASIGVGPDREQTLELRRLLP